MRVPPAELIIKGELPKRMCTRARPVRREIFESAKLEFERLLKYFYVESDSAIASPLVIAPKATSLFIRFCGDYRAVNNFITIPQQPIPIVQYELTKAAKFKIFVDLDMADSFHQIPLSQEFSDILSVQTPWGLFRPRFLPEGVGPASGLLQHLVRDIFNDFEEWTIVIFDNFLVLANDYSDALEKLKRILDRCEQFKIVLKLKKSFIGTKTVTFFGYEVSDGSWQLSDARKSSIMEWRFPENKKEMQSFLGAALFFHHHVPHYSEWSARLYETTHDDFKWDEKPWKFDYVSHFETFKTCLLNSMTLYFPHYSEWSARLYETTHDDFKWDEKPWKFDYVSHFEIFKTCLLNSMKLFFPDYSLPWGVRTDAAKFAVGGLFFRFTRILLRKRRSTS